MIGADLGKYPKNIAMEIIDGFSRVSFDNFFLEPLREIFSSIMDTIMQIPSLVRMVQNLTSLESLILPLEQWKTGDWSLTKWG